MEFQFAAVVAVALLVLFPCYAQATEHTVGESERWSLGVNYTNWASGKTFLVGDTLVFKYTSVAHNVLEVSKSAYDSCQTSNPRETHTGGTTKVALNTAGTEYFICGVTGHCGAGMKLAVTISAANSAAPTTPAAPSPSTESTAPAPTNAGQLVQMKDAAVLVIVSVVMLAMLV